MLCYCVEIVFFFLLFLKMCFLCWNCVFFEIVLKLCFFEIVFFWNCVEIVFLTHQLPRGPGQVGWDRQQWRLQARDAPAHGTPWGRVRAWLRTVPRKVSLGLTFFFFFLYIYIFFFSYFFSFFFSFSATP